MFSSYRGLVGEPGETHEPYAFRTLSPCVDAVGNVVVADSLSNRIMMVGADGGFHELVGGSSKGYLDGPVDSAMFGSVTSVAIDRWGNLVIADQHNSAVRWMRPREESNCTHRGTRSFPCGGSRG